MNINLKCKKLIWSELSDTQIHLLNNSQDLDSVERELQSSGNDCFCIGDKQLRLVELSRQRKMVKFVYQSNNENLRVQFQTQYVGDK